MLKILSIFLGLKVFSSDSFNMFSISRIAQATFVENPKKLVVN